jgi:hypothetical protein
VADNYIGGSARTICALVVAAFVTACGSGGSTSSTDSSSITPTSPPTSPVTPPTSGPEPGTPAPGTGGNDTGASQPPPDEEPTEPGSGYVPPGGIEAPEKRNLAPTISGTPATKTWVDDAYVFQPTASDADGDTLVYSVTGLPAWAQFDTRTGRLHGTPRDAHVGTYANVVVGVSDGRRSATLPAFSIQVVGNLAPSISGTPAVKTLVDDAYDFQPYASDAEGDVLTFSITGQPAWAEFDPRTGRLHGTPRGPHVGTHGNVVISVSDGRLATTLPAFSIQVAWSRKASYGHYFATRYADKPADAARLCSQAGVTGVVWRRTWREVEPSPGNYDFSSFDQVLDALAASTNPDCQLWIFVEFKSFANSPVKNPCPVHLQQRYSGPNADGNGASTCFMWEPEVIAAYAAMMQAASARYDANPRVEGLIFQESALGFNGAYSQDVAAGGTYTGEAWRDGLISLIQQCSKTFRRSRCLAFLNFLRNGQKYLHDVSAAISAVPENRACMSGPDLLPDNTTLYNSQNAAYEVLTRHRGCRSNSAQNDSYEVTNYGMDAIFNFAVRGTLGDFDQVAPRQSGLCVNSYLFWNNRVAVSATGLNWTSALPVIAAYPYGPLWLDQCSGGGAAP